MYYTNLYLDFNPGIKRRAKLLTEIKFNSLALRFISWFCESLRASKSITSITLKEDRITFETSEAFPFIVRFMCEEIKRRMDTTSCIIFYGSAKRGN